MNSVILDGESTLLQKLLSLITPMDKVALFREILDFESTSDISDAVTVSPSATSGTFVFSFYGTESSYKDTTVLRDVGAFKSHIHQKIDDAKIVYDQKNTVATILAEETPFSMEEFIAEKLPHATTEDEVSEIFDGDFDEFTRYYNSPARSTLEQEQRGFLQQIYKSPFLLLWTKADGAT